MLIGDLAMCFSFAFLYMHILYSKLPLPDVHPEAYCPCQMSS